MINSNHVFLNDWLNVRVKAKKPNSFIKNVANRKFDDRYKKLHMITKVVMEKQSFRDRYIKLMNDADRAFGRKEAIYLLIDAEII